MSAPAAALRLLSDAALLTRARRGSEAAFAAIFSRHHQGLYRYALSILRSPDDARDAVQNTMVSLLAALPGEERELALKPWLYRIAHNEAISIIRRRREDSLDSIPEPGGEADHELRLRTHALLADLAELPDQQRTALVLRELNGLSHAEIGEALTISEAAAKQTVYTARKALQESEQGREMTCADSQRQISDGDRRRLRGRALRAHLSDCSACRAFEASIRARRTELAGIAPMPAALSAGLLSDLLGSGIGPGGGAALAGTATGGGLALSTGGAKLTSVVVAISAAGLAAGIGDRVQQRSTERPDRAPIAAPSAEQPDAAPVRTFASRERRSQSRSPLDDRRIGGTPGAKSPDRRGGGGGSKEPGAGKGVQSNSSDRSPGSGAGAPGSPSPSPATPPSSPAASAPGASGSAPGTTGTAPGQSGSTPGQSGAAPGQSGASPPGLADIAPGLAGTAPGLAGTAPGRSGIVTGGGPPVGVGKGG